MEGGRDGGTEGGRWGREGENRKERDVPIVKQCPTSIFPGVFDPA